MPRHGHGHAHAHATAFPPPYCLACTSRPGACMAWRGRATARLRLANVAPGLGRARPPRLLFPDAWFCDVVADWQAGRQDRPAISIVICLHVLACICLFVASPPARSRLALLCFPSLPPCRLGLALRTCSGAALCLCATSLWVFTATKAGCMGCTALLLRARSGTTLMCLRGKRGPMALGLWPATRLGPRDWTGLAWPGLASPRRARPHGGCRLPPPASEARPLSLSLSRLAWR